MTIGEAKAAERICIGVSSSDMIWNRFDKNRNGSDLKVCEAI